MRNPGPGNFMMSKMVVETVKKSEPESFTDFKL